MIAQPPRPRLTAAIVGAVSLGLLGFSQLGAIYDGDEGLHLVAAQLVQAGRQPFADFFYWHQPLYLYAAAGWMSLVADGWRGAHALSALLTGVTAALVGGFVPRSAERDVWRPWSSALAVVFFGLNVLVVKWGTIGHNYALCLLFSVGAFRLSSAAVSRGGGGRPWSAGVCAGGAAATSLLAAPLAPILAMRLLVHRGQPWDWRALATFVCGLPIAFLPLVALLAQAPDRTIFGVLTHHLYFRVPFADPATVQFDTLTAWLTSPQALVLLSLFLVACATLWRKRVTGRLVDSDVWWCAVIACGLAGFVTVAHPPALIPYYVLASPFAAIVAAHGASLVARRTRREWLTVGIVAAAFGAGLLLPIYRGRLWRSDWDRIEQFAVEVSRVTPRGEGFYTTFPFIYVAARRAPPPGTENGWAAQMALPPERFGELGVMPMRDITGAIESGRFHAVVLLDRDPRVKPEVYPRRLTLDQYWSLAWQPESRE